MRIVDLVLAVFFAAAAALQYNDPDPFRWALEYLVACGLALGMFRIGHWNERQRRALGIAAILLGMATFMWMMIWWPGMREFMGRGAPFLLVATMVADDPVIEEGREFLGLCVVLLYSIYVIVSVQRRVVD